MCLQSWKSAPDLMFFLFKLCCFSRCMLQQKPRDSSCGLAQKLGFLLALPPAASSKVSEHYDALEQHEIWHQAAMMHSGAA